MELITAIALLCQINYIEPGERAYTIEDKVDSCQRYYVECIEELQEYNSSGMFTCIKNRRKF